MSIYILYHNKIIYPNIVYIRKRVDLNHQVLNTIFSKYLALPIATFPLPVSSIKPKYINFNYINFNCINFNYINFYTINFTKMEIKYGVEVKELNSLKY
jgi:hypothetical protein